MGTIIYIYIENSKPRINSNTIIPANQNFPCCHLYVHLNEK